MFIELLTSSGKLNFEVFPSVTYEIYCEFHDFPEVDYNSDMFPIYHIIKLVVSMEEINDEIGITDEIEEILKEEYWLDAEREQLIIARMTITEFPNLWRERMDVNWSYWLDAIDGDHAVIGLRADEILKRKLYDDPFNNGSLYYIQNVDVHDSFISKDIEINLIRYTFRNFIQNDMGMVFFIAQTINHDRNATTNGTRVVIDRDMIGKLEKGGFSRIFNSTVKDKILEIEVYKLQYF